MKKDEYSEAFSEVERKRDNPALMVTSQQHLLHGFDSKSQVKWQTGTVQLTISLYAHMHRNNVSALLACVQHKLLLEQILEHFYHSVYFGI